MHIPDLFTRSYLPSNQGREEFEGVNQLDYVPILRERLVKIQQASIDDSTLAALTIAISEGWPNEKKDVDVKIHPYIHSRDELIVQDRLVFKKGPGNHPSVHEKGN